jgi:shikimate dehydrogenase
MKKYLVIGNPIGHSLSPKLHNYWLKKYNIVANYEKRLSDKKDLRNLIKEIKEEKIQGINITVPFKRDIYNILLEDEGSNFSLAVENTKSVNTVSLDKNGNVYGDNTDVEGFKKSLQNINYKVEGRAALVLGAGGVVPSVLEALNILNIGSVAISNRTKEKSIEIQKKWSGRVQFQEVVEWGEHPRIYSPDIVINCTSLGLKENDHINLDMKKFKPKFFLKKRLFYDVIYNPPITNFLKEAKKIGNNIENGNMMFIYQASAAFKTWHGVEPEIDSEVIKFLTDD